MKKYLAEGIGTFAIIFCGTGAIIVNGETGGVITHSGIAAVSGLIVAAMIYTLGEISGAHFNPAVTISFWLAKSFPGKEIFPYSINRSIYCKLHLTLIISKQFVFRINAAFREFHAIFCARIHTCFFTYVYHIACG